MPEGRVLVAGSGAVGGWLGARLWQAGCDVQLLGRPPLAQAVARHGLVVQGLTETTARPVVHTTAPEGPFDVVFVTTKAHHSLAIAPQAARMAGPDGVVASLQNGVGNGEKLAAAAGAARVAVCLTSHGITVDAPGRLRHAGAGDTLVGAMGSADGHAADIALRWLEAAGLQPRRMQDTRAAVWTKAAVNAAINPLAALHRCRNGEVLEHHWDQAKALADEVAALAKAAGVAVGDVVAATRLTLGRTAGNRCSMLQDVQASRATEVEQITGFFVRAARRLGYPLHRNEEVYRSVKALEASYLGEEAALETTRQEAEHWQLV